MSVIRDFYFVTIKKKSYWVILCYEVALDWLWHQGRVSKFLELACPWTHKEEKTIPVWFFHRLQFHAISLSSSARIRVRQEMRHRVNNGKQRTTLCWRASLYKNKLAQVSDTGLKLVIIMIRLKRAKLQTPIKFFFFLSLRASGIIRLSLQMMRF